MDSGKKFDKPPTNEFSTPIITAFLAPPGTGKNRVGATIGAIVVVEGVVRRRVPWGIVSANLKKTFVARPSGNKLSIIY